MKNTITANYRTSIFKPNLNGWRQETVTAVLEQISAKKYRVLYIADIPTPTSKRQYFNTSGIMAREVGKVKLLSSLYGIEQVTEAQSA